MAAAPLPLADPEYSSVSPELALVDPELAAELRERLGRPDETAVAVFEPVVVEVVEPTPPTADDAEVALPNEEPQGAGSVDDLIVFPELPEAVAPSWVSEDVDPILDLIVAHDVTPVVPPSLEAEEVAHVVDETQLDVGVDEAGTTSYPALPVAETQGSDPTDVVLREIRDRLTGASPVKRRRLRRRFTIASGVGALAAVAVLIADLHFQLVQLPS